MNLTKQQRALLIVINEFIASSEGAENPMPLETLDPKFAQDIVTLQGADLLEFTKSKSDGEVDGVRLTNSGFTTLALLEIEKEIDVPAEPSPKLKKLKEPAGKMIDPTTGKEVDVSKLQVLSTQLRQASVKFLKRFSPDDYEKYKQIKFEGVEVGERPSLEQSKKAYLWAFERFLNISYTKSGV